MVVEAHVGTNDLEQVFASVRLPAMQRLAFERVKGRLYAMYALSLSSPGPFMLCTKPSPLRPS